MSNSTSVYNITASSYDENKSNNKTVAIIIFTVEILLVAIGLIGNSLSFAVLVKTDLRKLSTTAYLIVLSVCDNIVLLNVLVVSILGSEVLLDKNILNVHLSLCLIYTFLPFWIPQISAWCFVAVTLERAVAVLIPHK